MGGSVISASFLLSLFITNLVYEYIHTFNSLKLKHKKDANNSGNLLHFFLHIQILKDIILLSIVNFFIKVKLFFHCVVRYILFNRKKYIPAGSQDKRIVGADKHSVGGDSNYVDAHNEGDFNKRKNVQVKTIYFIRHSESVWNSVFNRRLTTRTFLNLFLVFVYEIFFFFSKKSVLVDSPLSNTGIIQSIELSNFLQQEKNGTKNGDKLCVAPISALNREDEQTRVDEDEDVEMADMNNQMGDSADGDDGENDSNDNSSPNQNNDSANYAHKNTGDDGPVVDYVHAGNGRAENSTGQILRKRRAGQDADSNANANASTNRGTYQDGNAYTDPESMLNRSDTHVDDNHLNNQKDHPNDLQMNRNYYQEKYNPREIINQNLKDHIDILNSSVKYPSAILCSDLRRAISSCFIALYNRINKNNEPIQVLNSLQEISRNPDCVSLFDFHDNKYISTDVEKFVHKDVEKNCVKNIRIKRNFVNNKFLDTLSYIFNNDKNIFIIFGHSLWFLLFFKYFLKQPHKAKTHKMQNSGIVVFNIIKYDQDNKVNYEIEKDSVRVLYKGFLDEEYNKFD
ncbi:conserved Plasmodium protein, unknown function [Plasmodium knowlesi strain H]|uniref:Phosphoglycerate mutase n=3 Tax=Plasmodium knowlesi TaxID=5850 RepID=A0A5K1VHX6_PLAKH|nr:conserved Plasmodium protein, unknown function [Plasmodium knowlesi strain H]OTN67837.1 Uncharacterized protein PKNOH_S05392600 [Plasmodium knowlesi]CAA9990513.1 conserved Plasmodium protein, unknown function [Plasmodium knowlesi strain H]SBO19750.1 conserved Plasmodium protein, unknown function [Plasmodium knowlesi strain H]SBO22450.1 conserved Plasmodium protein, unknown function [Plasmodium knowlesi strain H]VVS79987.1 conserved Plasmodium protein, unknown function [Plasmodium knowlesi s|eukprot:XP_002260903.1 hypothetical protein, conserved in Plasmodium species [Plasmodium knowlesi strain H]